MHGKTTGAMLEDLHEIGFDHERLTKWERERLPEWWEIYEENDCRIVRFSYNQLSIIERIWEKVFG
jgi:hypothetical protein